MAEVDRNDDDWLEQLSEALRLPDDLPGEVTGDAPDEVTGDPAAELAAEIDQAAAQEAAHDPEWEAYPQPVAPAAPDAGPEPEPEPEWDAYPDDASSVPVLPAPLAPADMSRRRERPEPEPQKTAETIDDASLVLEALAALSESVSTIGSRLERLESAEPADTVLDQVKLQVVVADAIRAATMKAQATGAGTVRLETEVRLLEQSVAKLSKQVANVNVDSLIRDRHNKDVHVERIVDAADHVDRQLSRAAAAQSTFEAGVEKMLRHAREGDGENVAWADVMLLAHELRARVDDLDEQQRRAMSDLTEWQDTVDDRLSELRTEVLAELRAERDQA